MSLQQTLFPPDSAWKPPRVADLPQDWNAHPRIGLDTETCDPLLTRLGPGVRRGAYIAGVSFATDEAHGWYTPLRHLGGDNVEDPERALAYYRYQARHYRGEIVGAKLGYDLDMLAEAGVEFPQATFKDVQVAEPLLDELQYSYSLDSILGRRGLALKDETVLRAAASAYGIPDKEVKAQLHKLPARYVGPYAEGDVFRPLTLLRIQEALIEEQGLQRVWRLGCRVLPVLVKMRRRGVLVDFDQLDRVERWANAEENKAWGEVQRLTGVAVRVGDGMKAELLARVFRAVDIEPGRTATGKPSITAGWLETIPHPVGVVVRRARKMDKLKNTFIKSIREHAIGNRIHCTFNQTRMEDDADGSGDVGAAFGRLSCRDPNMQFQPTRDPEIGPMWRAVYVAPQGMQWGQLDFSQQEPGLALHYAVISGPSHPKYGIGQRAHAAAMEAAERKRRDPSMDYHTMFTSFVYGDQVLSMSKKELKPLRDPMKQVFLGICYGMGGPKLCRKLGYPTKIIEHSRSGRRQEVAGDEGQALLDLVDSRVPYIRKTAESVQRMAKDRGYVVTMLGRRLHFERDQYGNLVDDHKSFNKVIQGSAAEQTQEAMVALDDMGAPMELQVHDELDLPLESREQGERYARAMEACLPLQVPSRVDVELGANWGDVGD